MWKKTPCLCLLMLVARLPGAAAQEELPLVEPAYDGVPAFFTGACRPGARASLGHVQLPDDHGAVVHPGVSLRGRVDCDAWRLFAKLKYVSPNQGDLEYGQLRVRLERSLPVRHLSLVVQTESNTLESQDALRGGLGFEVPEGMLGHLCAPRLRFLYGTDGFVPQVDLRIDGSAVKDLLTGIF